MPRETGDYRLQLATAIKDAVDRTGEPVPEIAERLGMPRNSLYAIASGNVAKWTVDALVEVCEKLGVDVTLTITGAPDDRGEIDNRPGPHRRTTTDDSVVGGMKLRLIRAISAKINAYEGSQGELVEETGIIRPTISRLKNKYLDYFRLDKLLELAPKFGLEVTLETVTA
ncbi:XRE family transcriptional regulator [Nocardia fluminea]|uniref:XRE family transcriptional regulator n=1 Tax=Nocardia fluminea TaxID=134984 RepID=UPI0036559816